MQKEKLVPEEPTRTHSSTRTVISVLVAALLLLAILLCIIGAAFMAGWSVGRYTYSSVTDTAEGTEENSSPHVEQTTCSELGCQENPASSCKQISEQQPNAPSRDYWLKQGGGDASLVFCNMDLSACSGAPPQGWTQVVNLTINKTTTECPGEFQLSTFPDFGCGRHNDTVEGCSSAYFTVHGVSYTQVSGRVYGLYEKGHAHGLDGPTTTLEGPYLAGVSITISHPRKHIWSFAAGIYYLFIISEVLAVTGNDYFCEGEDDYQYYDEEFYEHDVHGTSGPLWDGRGCGSVVECCTRAPWFCKTLSEPTTSDIEVRICGNHDVNTPIFLLELYVQ